MEQLNSQRVKATKAYLNKGLLGGEKPSSGLGSRLIMWRNAKYFRSVMHLLCFKKKVHVYHYAGYK
jgi:hypothetical protein